MEKKLLVIAATLLAKLVWRFGKITSGPLRYLVFFIIQAGIGILFQYLKKRKTTIA